VKTKEQDRQIIHRGNQSLHDKEIAKKKHRKILIVMTTVPDAGIGGKGATTDGQIVVKKLKLRTMFHSGGTQRIKAYYHYQKHDPEKIIGLTPGAYFPDELLKLYLTEIRLKRGASYDKEIDRDTIINAYKSLHQSSPIAVVEGKIATFLVDYILSDVPIEDRPIIICVGVDTDEETAIERKLQLENQKRIESAKGNAKKPGPFYQELVLYNSDDIRETRKSRRITDEKELGAVYQEELPNFQYNRTAVIATLHYILDSTWASPEKQISELMYQITKDCPSLAPTLFLNIAYRDVRQAVGLILRWIGWNLSKEFRGISFDTL
jgi:hypothetical protein